MNYPDLSNQLQLLPAEFQKLLDLLAEAEIEGRVNLAPTVFDGQADQSRLRSSESDRQMILERRDESIAGLLGSTRLERFRKYEKERPSRKQVSDLGEILGALGMPLNEAQNSALIAALVSEKALSATEIHQIIYESSSGKYSPRVSVEQTGLQLQEVRNERTLERAMTHLSPSQLEVFRILLDQPLAGRRAIARARDKQSGD